MKSAPAACRSLALAHAQHTIGKASIPRLQHGFIFPPNIVDLISLQIRYGKGNLFPRFPREGNGREVDPVSRHSPRYKRRNNDFCRRGLAALHPAADDLTRIYARRKDRLIPLTFKVRTDIARLKEEISRSGVFSIYLQFQAAFACVRFPGRPAISPGLFSPIFFDQCHSFFIGGSVNRCVKQFKQTHLILTLVFHSLSPI